MTGHRRPGHRRPGHRLGRRAVAATGCAVVLAALLAGCGEDSGDRPQASGTAAPSASSGAPGASATTPATSAPSSAPSGTSAPGATPGGTAPAGVVRPGGPARPPAAAPADARPGGRWRGPVPGEPWQWQLSGTVDTSVPVPVYDLDGEETSSATVARLHQQGRRVICYVNAGAAEDFRSDRKKFPAAVLGKENGWPQERWLDIRRLDVVLPVMAARFDTCRRKGFDAVEADLVEAYANDTGFPIMAKHQLAYNRALAKLAHERGLAIALKNDLGQIPQLVNDFDFAVNEQCFEFDECDRLLPFIRAGKAVLHVEYELGPSSFCPRARAMGFSSMRKKLDLGAARTPC